MRSKLIQVSFYEHDNTKYDSHTLRWTMVRQKILVHFITKPEKEWMKTSWASWGMTRLNFHKNGPRLEILICNFVHRNRKKGARFSFHGLVDDNALVYSVKDLKRSRFVFHLWCDVTNVTWFMLGTLVISWSGMVMQCMLRLTADNLGEIKLNSDHFPEHE